MLSGEYLSQVGSEVPVDRPARHTWTGDVFFRALPDAALVFVLDGSAAGRVVDANDAALALIGRSLEELTLLSVNDLVLEEEIRTRSWLAHLQADGCCLTRLRVHKSTGGSLSCDVRARTIEADEEKLVIATLSPTGGLSFPHEHGDRHQDNCAFRQMADLTPQVMWMATPDGIVDYFNDRVRDVHRIIADDGSWAWEASVHPDDLPHTLASWEKSVRGAVPHEVEHRMLMATGEYRWHLSRAYPLLDDQGRVLRWFGSSTDIHELKVAKAEAQTARERLEMALEAAEMGTWERDLISGVTSRSLRHDQIFGYSEPVEEWTLDRARAHVHPDDLDDFDRLIREADRDGILRHEVRILSREGAVRWIYSLGRTYYDDEDQPVRRSGVVMDITDRKDAEERLRKVNQSLEDEVVRRTEQLQSARDLFKVIFEVSPVPSAIIRLRDGVVFDVNPEFERVAAVSRDSVIGKKLVELHLWDDIREIAPLVHRFRHLESIRDEEVQVKDSTGRIHTLLLSAAPIMTQEGAAAIVKFVDITERKAAEEAIRQLTTALTLAEQRERRRLSHMLHDDLQQILFGIDMRVMLLEQVLDRPEVDRDRAVAQVGSIRSLLSTAVQSTRVLAIELNPPVLPGEGLVAALHWLARHMEELHGLTVEVRSPEQLDVLGEDRRVLVIQLVRELLFNVVKHAGVRRARIEAEQADGRLQIVVSDEGQGFDVLASTDMAGLDSLGLFSVEQRLHLFGGSMLIDSGPGKGTKVRIELQLE